jgi:hypothetical protein
MSNDKTLSDALTDLNSLIQTSSLNASSSIGEIVCQLVFLLAHDTATSRLSYGSFSNAVNVKQFLTVLVGDDQYLKTMEDNISTEMKEGLVYFTHFIKKLDELTFEDVIPNFVARGAAVQLKDGAKDIDLVIPVVLETGEIGYIVIKVENRAEQGSLKEVAWTTLPQLSFFRNSSRSGLNPNHFLGLVMSLGETENTRQKVENVELVEFKLENKKAITKVKANKCCNFILHGLSKETYPFLSNDVSKLLKKLLDCDRQNVNSMNKIYGAEVLERVAIGCAKFQKIR